MNVLEKYRRARMPALDGTTPLEHGVLSSFQKVIDGTAGPYVFRMISDEDARSVLDDDDYDIWRKARAAILP